MDQRNPAPGKLFIPWGFIHPGGRVVLVHESFILHLAKCAG